MHIKKGAFRVLELYFCFIEEQIMIDKKLSYYISNGNQILHNNQNPLLNTNKKDMSETGTRRIASHMAKPVRLDSERTESGKIDIPIKTDSPK